MDTKPQDDEELEPGTERRFKVLLGIMHPSLAPKEIAARIGMRPYLAQAIGAPRRGGRGQLLKGTYKQTRCALGLMYIAHDQWFAVQLKAFVERLVPCRGFLEEVRASGGATHLTLQFLDGEYHGDVIPPRVLGLVAELGFDLGIETFGVPQNVESDIETVRLPVHRSRAEV